MYPEMLVRPMREELTRLGVEELRTVEAVDAALDGARGIQIQLDALPFDRLLMMLGVADGQ